MYFINDPSHRDRRIKLRKNMTPVEVLLWSRLKGKQLLQSKFRRQVSMHGYVVDFYCPKYHLVVEIDGEEHFQNQLIIDYDKQRQACIESLGMNVIRVTGQEVNTNIEGVLASIARYLTYLPSVPSSKRRGGKTKEIEQ